MGWDLNNGSEAGGKEAETEKVSSLGDGTRCLLGLGVNDSVAGPRNDGWAYPEAGTHGRDLGSRRANPWPAHIKRNTKRAWGGSSELSKRVGNSWRSIPYNSK